MSSGRRTLSFFSHPWNKFEACCPVSRARHRNSFLNSPGRLDWIVQGLTILSDSECSKFYKNKDVGLHRRSTELSPNDSRTKRVIDKLSRGWESSKYRNKESATLVTKKEDSQKTILWSKNISVCFFSPSGWSGRLCILCSYVCEERYLWSRRRRVPGWAEWAFSSAYMLLPRSKCQIVVEYSIPPTK